MTDMRNTLRTFFDTRMRIAPAAERLFLHRNTLINRLERIQSLLGHSVTERTAETQAALVLAACSHHVPTIRPPGATSTVLDRQGPPDAAEYCASRELTDYPGTVASGITAASRRRNPRAPARGFHLWLRPASIR